MFCKKWIFLLLDTKISTWQVPWNIFNILAVASVGHNYIVIYITFFTCWIIFTISDKFHIRSTIKILIITVFISKTASRTSPTLYLLLPLSAMLKLWRGVSLFPCLWPTTLCYLRPGGVPIYSNNSFLYFTLISTLIFDTVLPREI